MQNKILKRGQVKAKEGRMLPQETLLAIAILYTVQLTSDLTIARVSLASNRKFSKTIHELDAIT